MKAICLVALRFIYKSTIFPSCGDSQQNPVPVEFEPKILGMFPFSCKLFRLFKLRIHEGVGSFGFNINTPKHIIQAPECHQQKRYPKNLGTNNK